MAVLAELFLVLAGFDSGVSQRATLHPFEAATFDQARAFGSKIQDLRHLTSVVPNPVCRVLKQEIVVKYLEALARLEASTVEALLGDGGVTLTDSLRFSARIIGQSVDRWERLVQFGLDFLAQLDQEFEDYYRWLGRFVNRHAGYHDLRTLGEACLAELDRRWLTDLRSCILGEIKELNNHPALAGNLDVVEDVRTAISMLKDAAFRDLRVLELVVGLMKEISDLLVPDIAGGIKEGAMSSGVQLGSDKSEISDNGGSVTHSGSHHPTNPPPQHLPTDSTPPIPRLSLPLDAGELHTVLAEVQRRVSRSIRTQLIASHEVACLLTLLRDVVLCGSSLFEHALADAHGQVEPALDAYFDHTDPQAIVSIYAETARKLLTVRDNRLHIRLSGGDKRPGISTGSTWFLRLLVSRDQCAMFESIFDWLARIVTASSRIPVGGGVVAWRYKLFYTELWGYYQTCIDEAMASIREIMASDRGLNIRREDDAILRRMQVAMFLESREYRALLADVTASDFHEVGPLARITSALRDVPGHTMNLRAFEDLR